MRHYPSLSFGEYNSRRGSFFTPLDYFLAGHYLDPWDVGEGGLRSGPIFYLFSDVNFGCQNWPNLVQFLVIFCFNFGLFFFRSRSDLGVFWDFSWASWGFSGRSLEAKTIKFLWFFMVSWNVAFWPLSSLHWFFRVHFVSLGPLLCQLVIQNGTQYQFKKSLKVVTHTDPKNEKIRVPEWVSNFIKNEIAGLRHFLPALQFLK